MNVLRVRRSAMVLGALLLAGLTGGREAQGQEPKKGSIVKQLKSANDLLRQANHNYKGHRVKAMHEVNRALVALGAKKIDVDVGTKNLTGEEQALSNKQLARARQKLADLLVSLGTPAAGSPRARAVNHVKKAIVEIDLALAVVGKKG